MNTPPYRPLVSVITPTYNHEKYIRQCIDSVLAQSYTLWEQIIIDDGSTDDTSRIIQQYNDPRIRYFHQKNLGMFRLRETYNRALNLARGELVAILEGDDFWPPDKLETLAPAFRDPEIVLAYGFTAQVTHSGVQSPKTIPPPHLKGLPRSALFNDPVGSAARAMARLDLFTYTFPCSVVIRHSALKSINGFQGGPGFFFVDYPTFLYLSLRGKFFFFPRIMGYWRRHHVSASMTWGLESILPQARDFTLSFLDEHRTELRLLPSERQAIEQNWKHFGPRIAYARGRRLLVLKQWPEARARFRMAFAADDPALRLKALLGYCASWLHQDLEGIARLVKGKGTDLTEVFDLEPEADIEVNDEDPKQSRSRFRVQRS